MPSICPPASNHLPIHLSKLPEMPCPKRQIHAYAEYYLNLCLYDAPGASGATPPCVALVMHMLNICSKLTWWCLALLSSARNTTWYILSICTAYLSVNHLPADGDGGGVSSSGNGGGSGPRWHIVSICARYVKDVLTFLLLELGVPSAGRCIRLAYALSMLDQNKLTRWKWVPNCAEKTGSARLKALAGHMPDTCWAHTQFVHKR